MQQDPPRPDNDSPASETFFLDSGLSQQIDDVPGITARTLQILHNAGLHTVIDIALDFNRPDMCIMFCDAGMKPAHALKAVKRLEEVLGLYVDKYDQDFGLEELRAKLG